MGRGSLNLDLQRSDTGQAAVPRLQLARRSRCAKLERSEMGECYSPHYTKSHLSLHFHAQHQAPRPLPNSYSDLSTTDTNVREDMSIMGLEPA